MISKKITGRKCYDHLGGRLGAELFDLFLSREWIKLDEGRTTIYSITEKGYNEFKRMGLFFERVDGDA